MAIEVELKLALEPENVTKLRRHPLISTLATGRFETRKLVAIYFDTPAMDLSRRKMSFRIRHDGKGTRQTFKRPQITPGSGLQQSVELEHPVTGEIPNLDLLAKDGEADLIRELNLDSALSPQFTTDIQRAKNDLRLGDTRVELAIDRGTIRAGQHEMAVSEAEFELQEGAPARLYEIALELIQKIPFRWESRSKAARGFELASGTGPEPVRAGKVVLDESMSVADAFSAIAESGLVQLRGNEPVVLLGPEADPEGVHQMRVAIRRLRALVNTFRPSISPDRRVYLQTELRWLQSKLGPARDWDVFVTETLPKISATEDSAAIAALADAAEKQRRTAYADAIAAIKEPRYTEFLLRFALWLEENGWRTGEPPEISPTMTPVGDLASSMLSRLDRKMLKGGGKSGDVPEPSLHALRLIGKKQRYASEFFHGLYPAKTAKTYMKAAAAVQDSLGKLNDGLVGRALVRSVMRDSDSPEVAYACGLVVGWQAAAADSGRTHFKTDWQAFRKAARFWKG